MRGRSVVSLKKIVVATLLVLAGALLAPTAAAIASGGVADTLCVTESGALKARANCQADEDPFRVIDGKLHEEPLPARTAEDGRNSARSATKYATGGEFSAEESVETAARAFTKRWTLPKGWDGKIVDACPTDMVPISGNVYFPGRDPRYVPAGLLKSLGMPTVLIESDEGGPRETISMYTTQVCAPRVELEAKQG